MTRLFIEHKDIIIYGEKKVCNEPKGMKKMNTTGTFIKGVATGAIIGLGASLILHPMDKKDMKRMQQGSSRLFTTVGGMLDSVFNQ